MANSYGGVGNDTLTGGDDVDSLMGNDGDDYLSGGNESDGLNGGNGNDTLFGENGDDGLTGCRGNDSLAGGDGENDSIDYRSALHGVIVNLGTGAVTDDGFGDQDTVSGIEVVLVTSFDDVIIGNAADNWIVGDAGNDCLVGADGDDTFVADKGNDTMVGGTGHDTYEVDSAGDVVNETVAQGTDSVSTTISLTLPDNVEILSLSMVYDAEHDAWVSEDIDGSGNGVDNLLRGNEGANRLWGKDGNDLIYGFGGNDTLDGGAGDDCLIGDDGHDRFIGGAGNDSFSGDASDMVDYSGADGAITVNLASNTITKTETWAGTDWAPYIHTVRGTSYGDQFTGSIRSDTFSSGDGNDTINGGFGADTADYSDATIFVDGSLAIGTVYGGMGNMDTLVSIENLTGSAYNDTLTGNANANLLAGGGSDDRLTGGNGNDTIDGGAGVDVMIGGTENDAYYVDEATDKIIEAVNGGIDTVYSSISFSFYLSGRTNFEKLTLTGIDNINATGNALANTLAGNAGNNVLNGSVGADTMGGGSGDDTYYVDNTGDKVVEAADAGIDTVRSSISFSFYATGRGNLDKLVLTGQENISATGNALDNTLVGNAGNNILIGGIGADTLVGSTGKDILTGGGGTDLFDFNAMSHSGKTIASADKITDFKQLTDKIDLATLDANATLSGNQAFTFIGNTGFHHVAGELRYSQGGGHTYVMADTDGDGVADFLINLTGAISMEAGDFIL